MPGGPNSILTVEELESMPDDGDRYELIEGGEIRLFSKGRQAKTNT